MKRNKTVIITGGVVFLVMIMSLIAIALKESHAENNILDRVSQRLTIENKAKKMAEDGNLDQAVVLYNEAIRPEYVNYDYDRNTALGAIREIYKWKGEYDKALAITNDMLKKSPDAMYFIMERKEIEGLIRYTSTGDPEPVYQHISNIREQYKGQLPPLKYLAHSTVYISDILRLYDTIGDHDAGIAFIDEVLAYFRTGKAGDPKPGWVDAEYMKVREAFQQDKSQGSKGRATKALIQSDYFPW